MGGTLAVIVSEVIRIYTLIVLANVILSWFVNSSRDMRIRKIYWATGQLVDPMLDPIRRLLSPMTRNFGIDISPIVLIVFLQIVVRLITGY